MRIIIAGSRTATYEQTEAAIVTRPPDWDQDEIDEVVSGCAIGADTHGERWAEERGIPVRRFPAAWHTHGRAAGPIRNRLMAEYADALIVVWDGESRGTRNMIMEARRRGLRVHIHRVSADTEIEEG